MYWVKNWCWCQIRVQQKVRNYFLNFKHNYKQKTPIVEIFGSKHLLIEFLKKKQQKFNNISDKQIQLREQLYAHFLLNTYNYIDLHMYIST